VCDEEVTELAFCSGRVPNSKDLHGLHGIHLAYTSRAST
jgi:hypothetical protein